MQSYTSRAQCWFCAISPKLLPLRNGSTHTPCERPLIAGHLREEKSRPFYQGTISEQYGYHIVLPSAGQK
ncbi:hypothetical protein JZ751_003071 [Albula glossodonta]|uniref:Uncharacterized protein n=1 Tax=Albula glossodonta TaxID=121402 RepID=A0A8T2N8K4_9TELE|nr:hypothetical protein JZ751_003071 [Albula glossodonta]